jgi:hypothetical protein
MHKDSEVVSEGSTVNRRDEVKQRDCSEGGTVRKLPSRDACKPTSRMAGAKMREPDAGTVIKFNTSHRGTGYTYVAFRIFRSEPGEASWYPTGIQWEEHFPFNGIVTWEQILEFVGGKPIEIATEWKTHPDWQRSSTTPAHPTKRTVQPSPHPGASAPAAENQPAGVRGACV